MRWQVVQETPSRASAPYFAVRRTRIVGREGHRFDHVARERLAFAGLGDGVDVELPLALDAVAAEAGVLDDLRRDSGWKVWVSLASWAKKNGSRPARPIGELRQVP